MTRRHHLHAALVSSPRRIMCAAGLASAVVAGALATPVVAAVHPPGSDPAVATLEDCRERFFITPGVEDEVRQRVPERFELSRNAAGQPLLYITALHCGAYTANGVTQPTTVAAFGASIVPPDGVACNSAWPVVGELKPDAMGSCNNYLLFAAYDHPGVVEWARAAAADLPVSFVEDLSFDEDGLDLTTIGAPFHFDSPSTPSAYAMEMTVRERPVAAPLTGSFWFESASGEVVRYRFEAQDLAMGEATGRVDVAEGSEMATLLGTTTPQAQTGYSMLAGTHWGHATMTRHTTGSGG